MSARNRSQRMERPESRERTLAVGSELLGLSAPQRQPTVTERLAFRWWPLSIIPALFVLTPLSTSNCQARQPSLVGSRAECWEVSCPEESLSATMAGLAEARHR